jgi:hypothetical protein
MCVKLVMKLQMYKYETFKMICFPVEREVYKKKFHRGNDGIYMYDEIISGGLKLVITYCLNT